MAECFSRTELHDALDELCVEVVVDHLLAENLAVHNAADLLLGARLERPLCQQPAAAMRAVATVTSATCCSYTQTHRFNGPLSGTTRVGRYKKGKTNLDFIEARDWQWHQLGHMQVCTSLQTDNYASTPPLCFYRPDAL